MPLESGSKLGPYQILSVIGAGGMGEVYRAKDTRLDRTVAIKVLPSHLSSNQSLRERLEREARAVSALNHPSICTLHDVGHQDGTDFLVMEYIEGETLANRLTKGALPLDQALRQAVQIADALDKAHRQGIVHRDLKPGNIMLTKSGLKLLDFGLAKYGGQGRSPSEDLGSVSTFATEIAQNLTAEGTIVGTLQYMSPEQLEGKETDARTDIFAIGTVLYEKITGKKAFSGKSQASLISAILKDEPPPISQVQPLVPRSLDRVVKMCLAKDPDDRWQNAHDLMNELKWISEGATDHASGTSVHPHKSRALLWILAGALILAAAGWIAYFNRSNAPQKLMQLSIPSPPENEQVYAPAISPDGSRIVFPAADKKGNVNLWVRSFQSSNTQKIPGTEGASNPFWSPDSRFIGFFANRKLIKVDPSEGHSQTLCDVSDERGGTWNREGVIVFSPNPGDGLYRISSAGGVPTQITSLDPAAKETSHRYPYFLPDGKHFIFFIRAQEKGSGIYVGSLESQEKSFLLPSDRSAVFSSGYLLFQRSTTLLAQAFDTKQLKFSGEAIPLSENVWYQPQHWGTRGMAVSDNNLLTYVEGSNQTQLLWFDRTGHQEGSVGSPDDYAGTPSFSPDGKKFAMQVVDGSLAQIWLYESSGGTRSRLTFGPYYNVVPQWSPDGTRILFASDRNGPFELYLRDASGAGNEELLYQSKNWCHPADWSPDGQYITFTESNPKTNFDVWILRLGEQKKAIPFLVTDANEASAMFSPDGKWLAYSSDESGQPEVYVQPFLPEKGGKWQVSTNGGYTPKWSKDGKELFYLSLDNQITSSEVKLGSTFEAAVPRPLFAIHPYLLPRIAPWQDAFEPAPDGRFVVHSALTSSPPNITVVLNWPLLLTPKK